MAMVVKRRADRLAEAAIIKKAQVKKARRSDTKDFESVCDKFIEAVMKIREAMKSTSTTKSYDLFFGGYEQCDELLRDPAYHDCKEAQFAYQLLLGANSWLLHEADKLGADYVPPEHFYKCWDRTGINLRNLPV